MSGKKIAIVGAGPAGTAAAVQLARYGIAPLLFDMKGRAGGLIENAHAIENFPLLPAGLPGASFAALLRSRCLALGIDVIETVIEEISPEPGGRLSLISKDCVETESGLHAVLVAAGTTPMKIDAKLTEGLGDRRVFYEIVDMNKAVEPRRTAVIGSGDAAFDYALSLASRPGAEIGIFIRNDRAKCIPALAAACRDNPHISIDFNHELSRIEEEGEGISLRFDSPAGAREYPCDAVLAAVGRRSNLPDLAPEIDMDRISPSGTTNIPGLFAAGDIRRGDARQLAIAMGDGTAAAMEIIRYLEDG